MEGNLTTNETRFTNPGPPERAFLAGCLCLIVLLNVASMINKTATSDEPTHLAAALSFAQGRLERVDDAQMPFSVFNALPVLLLFDVPREEDAIWNDFFPLEGDSLFAGRLMTVLCSLILAGVVYLWSRRLYGPIGGGLSLLLYTFSPNILAHSRLITTDLFAALMFTLSLFTLWSFLNNRGWKRAVGCGAVLGISQLAKYSCVFLYPLSLLLGAAYGIRGEGDARGPRFRSWTARSAAVYSLLIIVVSLLMIQAGFLFDDVYRPLSEYEFKSDLFQSLQSRFSWIEPLPIPTPYLFLQGLDWVVFNDATGSSHGRIYLLGELRTEGFWSYYFDDVYRPPEYEFKSDLFQSLQSRFSWIEPLPIPTPYLFLQGLDWVVFNDATGSSHGRIYLLGELRTEGFWSYYLVALLFKVPLAGLLLFGWAAVLVFQKSSFERFRRNEIFLVGLVVWFCVYDSFFFDAQTGLRYLLPAFPAAYILCGAVAGQWIDATRRRKTVALVLLGWFVASSLSYHPHYLSYFNALVTDRKMAYKILADSNLDWAQNFNYLKEDLEAHPGTKWNPETPVSGRIVVGASSLVGIYADHPADRFAWLRDHFTPTNHIAYSWLVFDVTDEQLRSLEAKAGGISPRAISEEDGLVGFADTINGATTPTLRAGERVVIRGWAANSKRGAPVAEVEAFLGSETVGSTIAFFDRRDVVAGTGRQDFGNSGWEIDGKLPELSPGNYTLSVKATSQDGRTEWIISKEFTIIPR